MPALAAARALWRACVHLPAPDHLRVRFTPNQHLLAESCDLVGVLDFEHDLARAGAATSADKNVRARSEQRRKDQGRKTKPRCRSCRGEILMVGSGPSNVVGLGSGPRKQPGLGGNEILRSFLSTRRSWCWRGRGKQTVRMASTKSGFAALRPISRPFSLH